MSRVGFTTISSTLDKPAEGLSLGPAFRRYYRLHARITAGAGPAMGDYLDTLLPNASIFLFYRLRQVRLAKDPKVSKVQGTSLAIAGQNADVGQ